MWSENDECDCEKVQDDKHVFECMNPYGIMRVQQTTSTK